MNTLLVATDFSPAADNALQYAAKLALKLQTGIKLLHVYAVPVSMNDMPLLAVTTDSLQHASDDGINRLKQELAAQYPTLSIEGESRLGDIRGEIEDISNHDKPLAIVIGAHGSSGFERAVFGSTAAAIIRHSKIPVIAVPATYHDFATDKIMMATDLQNNHTIPVDDIKQWLQNLNAQLYIVHISATNKETPDEGRDLVSRFGDISPVYEVEYNHDLQKGIETHIKKIGADLLLVLPHQHSLLERIFFRQHTEELISHAHVPVLSICC